MSKITRKSYLSDEALVMTHNRSSSKAKSSTRHDNFTRMQTRSITKKLNTRPKKPAHNNKRVSEIIDIDLNVIPVETTTQCYEPPQVYVAEPVVVAEPIFVAETVASQEDMVRSLPAIPIIPMGITRQIPITIPNPDLLPCAPVPKSISYYVCKNIIESVNPLQVMYMYICTVEGTLGIINLLPGGPAKTTMCYNNFMVFAGIFMCIDWANSEMSALASRLVQSLPAIIQDMESIHELRGEKISIVLIRKNEHARNKYILRSLSAVDISKLDFAEIHPTNCKSYAGQSISPLLNFSGMPQGIMSLYIMLTTRKIRVYSLAALEKSKK